MEPGAAGQVKVRKEKRAKLDFGSLRSVTHGRAEEDALEKQLSPRDTEIAPHGNIADPQHQQAGTASAAKVRKLSAADYTAAPKRNKIDPDRKRKRLQLQPSKGQKRLCGFGFTSGAESRAEQVPGDQSHEMRPPANPPSAGQGETDKSWSMEHRKVANPPSVGQLDGMKEDLDRLCSGPSTSDGRARGVRQYD